MKRDQLDQAIDQVAAQLTRVEHDDVLSQRILASLPDRSPWLWHSWIPRLALTAMLAIAAAYAVLRPFDERSTTVLQTFDERSTTVLRTENADLPVVELRVAASQTIVERSWNDRRTTVEPPSNDRGTAVDFERSLAAIAALSALTLTPVATSDLPAESGLVVEPLAIADLPLEPLKPVAACPSRGTGRDRSREVVLELGDGGGAGRRPLRTVFRVPNRVPS